MKNIILIIILICSIYSCRIDSHYRKEVIKTLNEFPDSLTAHFKPMSDCIIYGISTRKAGTYYKNFGHSIEVLYNYDEFDIKDYQDKFPSIKLNQYGKFDFYGNKENIAFDGIVLYNDSLPIPSLISIESALDSNDTILERIPSDFELYLIDSYSGEFINKNELVEVDSISSEWKHGISKGFAVSEKRKQIIVWLVIW